MVEVGQFEMEIMPLSGSILDGRQQAPLKQPDIRAIRVWLKIDLRLHAFSV